MNDKIFLLVAAGVLAWLYLSRQAGSAFGRSDQTSANGIGPTGTSKASLTSQIGGAAGAGVCIGVATYFGATSAGVAAAPTCGKIGSAVAPYAKTGAVFLAKETAKGATFVAGEVYQGGKATVGFVGSAIKNPVAAGATTLEKSAGIVSTVSHFGINTVDRGAQLALGALPTPLRTLASPAVGIATKTANLTVDVGTKTAKTAVSAVKAVDKVATKAVSGVASGAKKLFSSIF